MSRVICTTNKDVSIFLIKNFLQLTVDKKTKSIEMQSNLGIQTFDFLDGSHMHDNSVSFNQYELFKKSANVFGELSGSFNDVSLSSRKLILLMNFRRSFLNKYAIKPLMPPLMQAGRPTNFAQSQNRIQRVMDPDFKGYSIELPSKTYKKLLLFYIQNVLGLSDLMSFLTWFPFNKIHYNEGKLIVRNYAKKDTYCTIKSITTRKKDCLIETEEGVSFIFIPNNVRYGLTNFDTLQLIHTNVGANRFRLLEYFFNLENNVKNSTDTRSTI